MLHPPLSFHLWERRIFLLPVIVYPPRAPWCRKLLLSLVSKLFLWASAFHPHPLWPGLNVLQQNLNRQTSLRCLDHCDAVLCQSEIWRFAKFLCFLIWALKMLRWSMALLCEQYLSKTPWNSECSNCLLHLSENDKSVPPLQKKTQLVYRGSESFLHY